MFFRELKNDVKGLWKRINKLEDVNLNRYKEKNILPKPGYGCHDCKKIFILDDMKKTHDPEDTYYGVYETHEPKYYRCSKCNDKLVKKVMKDKNKAMIAAVMIVHGTNCCK